MNKKIINQIDKLLRSLCKLPCYIPNNIPLDGKMLVTLLVVLQTVPMAQLRRLQILTQKVVRRRTFCKWLTNLFLIDLSLVPLTEQVHGEDRKSFIQN